MCSDSQNLLSKKKINNPFLEKVKKFIKKLRVERKGKLQEYKMELINLKGRCNISHSGITKEMEKIKQKINDVKPSSRKFEMLKSYIFFYQKKLSLENRKEFSNEIIDQKLFNHLYYGADIRM